MPTAPTPPATPVHVPEPRPAPEPQPLARPARPPASDPDTTPRSGRGRSATPRQTALAAPRASKLGAPFYLLLLYAVIMTGIAFYGFIFRYGSQIDPGHPLSTVPDNYGEFPPAERRKTGQLKSPPDGPVPPELRVGLGKKLEVGQVEVEPVKVEIRRLRVVTVPKSGKPFEATRDQAVVLTLKIRNTSDDLTLYPMDPAFTRVFTGTTGEARPGTSLEVGKQVYRGGAIAWPWSDKIAREYEAAQEGDATPLKPKETREYVVFTAADPKIVREVKGTGEPLLWRVQVRRGLISVGGKDVPVTAIIGVEFRSSDVQTPDG
jgi:hypothetical protein